MAEREIAVSKIVLTIGKKEIILTLDEARQLRDELDSALPRQASFAPIIYNPQIAPIFNPPYTLPQVWCTTSGASYLLSVTNP
jgi:hypothetical protein